MDLLAGGDGRDFLPGGNDRDRMQGDRGNDDLAGGFGDDLLCDQEGDDDLDGQSGGDQLFWVAGAVPQTPTRVGGSGSNTCVLPALAGDAGCTSYISAINLIWAECRVWGSE